MQNGNGKSRLVIHAAITPDEGTQKQDGPAKKFTWRVLPHPMNRKKRAPRAHRPRVKNHLSGGERLLRNTTIACAVLVVVLAVSRSSLPWANRVTEAISSAVTMRLSPDETLGKLNFVKNLMPDAALVFWNMGAEDALARPVAGSILHAWDGEQPWIEYQVSGKQPVYAAAPGTVAAISQGASGEWTVLIDHEDGEQTVYAFLSRVIPKAGQAVEAGAQLGETKEQDDARLYFELRENGRPVDPTKRLTSA